MKRALILLLIALALMASAIEADSEPPMLINGPQRVSRLTAPQSAADWFGAYEVPLPPPELQGGAIASPVSFLDQGGIDRECGGKDQVIACAVVGGGRMMLPNPCQLRFKGESYAALVCHEKGHTLGWNHG